MPYSSVYLQSLAQCLAHRRGPAQVFRIERNYLQSNQSSRRASTFVADIISISSAKTLIPSSFLLGQAGHGSCPGESSHLWPFSASDFKAFPPALDSTPPNAIHNPRLIANVLSPENTFLIPVVRIFSLPFPPPLQSTLCVLHMCLFIHSANISMHTKPPDLPHCTRFHIFIKVSPKTHEKGLM